MTERPPLMTRLRRLFWGPRTSRTDSAMNVVTTIGRIEVANFPSTSPVVEPAPQLDPDDLPWELRDDDPPAR